MTKLCYPAIFHPEETGYSVIVPDFEKVGYGCFTEGDSFEESCEMAFEAIGICIEDLVENEKEFPIASKPEDIQKDGKDFVVPIVFDMEKYVKENKTRMIKKTLTIPEWLNDIAEKENINFSLVLRNALVNQLGISM